MENLLAIVLEAHHAERNHHRWYTIRIGRDLLSDWTVRIAYGRAGQRGQECSFGGQDTEELRRLVSERLHRRLSAPRRIGCSYRLTEYQAAPGFNASPWFSGEMWAAFSVVDRVSSGPLMT